MTPSLIDTLIAQEQARQTDHGRGPPAAPPDSAVDGQTTDAPHRPSQKSRRCYHRVMSGLERGGRLRFLTLTSSNESPDTCQASFRALIMRLRRRGLVQGYIKVPERSKNGKQHLHILFRGSYVEQALVSAWWLEIHHARVVDIRAVKFSRAPRAVAAYMAKYMSKENAYRYSWDWGWVWRGFCLDWTALKKAWRTFNDLSKPTPFATCLQWWRSWLHGDLPEIFSILGQFPPSWLREAAHTSGQPVRTQTQPLPAPHFTQPILAGSCA